MINNFKSIIKYNTMFFKKLVYSTLIIKYETTIYDKLACYTLFLGSQIYVREIIISTYLRCYLEVFWINFSTFFQLSSWLKDNINLKQSQNHFFIYQNWLFCFKLLIKEIVIKMYK